jgi:hypothetical protein
MALIILTCPALGAAPEPMARWTFDDGARDSVGTLHGQLQGGAYVIDGRLVLDGNYSYVSTPPLTRSLTEKTLVARVRLGTLDQRGGGVLSLEMFNGLFFDSLVFAEREPLRWMAGSDDFTRTRNLTGAPPESGLGWIHLAVVYSADGTIAVYRDGSPYGSAYHPGVPPLTFPAGKGQVLIGARHTGGDRTFFIGEIDEAALYDRALTATEVAELVPPAEPQPSVARVWNEELLNAIRRDLPHPPVHARNLFTLSAAMYDAWAAFDSTATGYVYRGKHLRPAPAAARNEAISQAAYRILKERFAMAVGSTNTLKAIELRLQSLGYGPASDGLDPSHPAAIGRAVAEAVSAWFLSDGSRQAQGYTEDPQDPERYRFVNGYLATDRTGTGGTLVDVNHWQPLNFTDVVPTGQNGVILLNRFQEFLGAPWLGVRPFATPRTDPRRPGLDPGPPPLFGTSTHAVFVSNVVAVIRASSELSVSDGVRIDISPAGWGNHTLGSNDGHGRPVNPVTGRPYVPNVVPRADFARVLAEYWADGPQSETPPGHWNTLANSVSETLESPLRIGGVGEPVDRLEWDVKLYFALNAALHDAACAAWSLKRHYDSWRPLSAIRHLASLGQSTDPARPLFNAQGLPLIPDLIELVTIETAQPGGRHSRLPVGSLVIRAWRGEASDGVGWMRPAEWFPYQRRGFITPAFPGFVSGHSTFSRAAAEVLTAYTGSAFFPNGLGTFPPPGRLPYRLVTEPGPSQPVQLQWATYYDAADQAGISRIWGGIHPPADDFAGRLIGAQCGTLAWDLARSYFDGSISRKPMGATVSPDALGKARLTFQTVRGLHYHVQSAPALDGPFSDVVNGQFQARDSQHVIPVQADNDSGWFRVLQSDSP